MKKYLHLSLFLALSFLSYSLNAQVTYCTSMATNPSDEEIFNVTVGSLNNSSDCITSLGLPSIQNQYSDYTTLVPAPVYMQGETVPFSISVGTCGGLFSSGVAIFIDYNQNGFFEDVDERVFGTPGTTNGPHTVTGSFTVPANALLGTTRMRVMNVEGPAGTFISSCQSYGFGETEDYSFTVGIPVTCSSFPAADSASSTMTSVCPTDFFTLSLKNNITELGVTYQWQSSADSISWIDMAGAAAKTYSGSQVATSYYRCAVTCSSGPYTSYSNPVKVIMNSPVSCYCIPPASTYPGSYMWITDVTTTGGISNFMSPSGSSPSCYSDFSTVQTASNMQLATTRMTFTSASYPFAYSVWIDFNDNGIFDVTEKVISNSNPSASISITDSFTLAVSANPGTHKMRVRGEYSYNGAPADPCNLLMYGETEDYSFTVIAPQYCTPTPSSYACSYMSISNVISSGGVTEINNGSGCTGNSYSDFSGVNVASNFQGATTTLTLISSGYALAYSVWIDFNHNGSFENTEQVVSDPNSAGSYTVTKSFVIPATALPGTHRMRIRGDYFGNGVIPYDGCYQMMYGETEDYGFTVIPVSLCMGTPNPGSTLSSLSSVCPGVNFTLSMQNNPVESGLTFQWQSSADTITWTDIAGATATSFATSQVSSTYYRCNVTCSWGPSTAASVPLLMGMNGPTSCYCVPPVSILNYGSLYISNVTSNGGVSNINNSSGYSAVSYEDFNVSGNISNYQLASTSLTLTSGNYYPMAWAVWIDFNDDGIFDGLEKVVSEPNANVTTTVNVNFTVPLSATPGTHRMRIRGDYKYNGIPVDGCNQLTEGETEDYSFTVLTLNNCVPPASLYSCSDWISNVETSGGVSNFTNSTSCEPTSYSYFGNFKNASNVQLGKTNMSFSSWSYPNAYSVWIDYDDNNTFDLSERVIANNNTGQSYFVTDNFTVPMNAPAGTHRMRVRSEYFASGGAPADPCNQLFYGETEDYTFTVIPSVWVNQIVVSSQANATSIDVEADTLQMFATVYPANATNPAVKWTVTDGTGRASISSTGLLKALVNGTVNVTATSTDGTFVSSTMQINITNQVVTPDDLNILKDGGFATDGSLFPPSTPWYAWSPNGGNGYVSLGVCNMLTGNIGQIWELQVAQENYTVTNGNTYTVTLTAWADIQRTFNVSMEDPNNNYRRIGSSSDPNAVLGRSEWVIPVTTTPTTFTFHTTIDSVQFNTLTKFVFSSSNAWNSVYIDNVSLVNEVFQPASITVQPLANGGIWPNGSQQNIDWVTNNINQNVNVEYSSDGGTSWSLVSVVSPVKGYNSYPWTVPVGLSSNNTSMFRVITADSTVVGNSGMFTIGSAFNMSSGTVTTCDGYFFDSGGSTGTYQSYEYFLKTFVPATPGNKMSVNFTSFALESGYDNLYIYDGPDNLSPMVSGSPFTSTNLNGIITASAQNTSGALTFEFVSDGSVQYSGWEATLSCVPAPIPAEVTTTAAVNITSSSATTGGNVISDGGYPITSKGICWNTTGLPTIADSYSLDGSGLGSYSSNISTGASTTYYVRAYATSSQGTIYGNEITFTTPMPDPASRIFTLIGSAFYFGDGVTQTNWNLDINLNYAGTAGTVSTYTTNNLLILENGEFKVRENFNWAIPSFGYDEVTIIDDAANFERDMVSGNGNIKTKTTKVYTVSFIVDWSTNTHTLQLTALSPTFSTTGIAAVYSNAALVNGDIASAGIYPITQNGVCWSTSPGANLNFGLSTSEALVLGPFTSSVAGLNPTTTYYVRAYAVTAQGTFFGNELSFTTYSNDASVSSLVYTVDPVNFTVNNVALTETLATFKLNLSPAAGASFEVYQGDGITVATDLQTGYIVRGIAQDGITTLNYTVNINIALSNASQILSFKVAGAVATIDAFVNTVTAVLPYGTNITNIVPNFQISAGANATVLGITQVSGLSNQDFTSTVAYDVTAEDGTIINWLVTITVTAPSTDASLSSIFYAIDNFSNRIYNVPSGESLSAFKNNLYPAPDAILQVYQSDGTTVATDLQRGYIVKVTAQDGITTNSFTVVSSQADLLSFSVAGIPAVVNSAARMVDVTVPFGTDVTSLVPVFTISDAATAYVGVAPQYSGFSTMDFSNTVYYEVVAEDGFSYSTWTVNVYVTPPSSDNTLSSLAYAVDNFFGSIQNVPFSTTLPAFVSNLTVAANATFNVYMADGITPASDVQSGYWVIVTAQNGSTRYFGVTKNASISSDASFTSFVVAGFSAAINSVSHEVTLQLPYGYSINNLSPFFTFSTGASINIAGIPQFSGLSVNDYTSPVSYYIIAEDGTIIPWSVILSVTPGSSDATLTSTNYVVDNVGLTITNVPGTESLALFRSRITPAANASFEVYMSNGTTVASDLQTGYLVKVTAQDGTINTYNITLNPIGSSQANMLSFKIAGINGVITNATKSVAVTLPYGTSLNVQVPIFSISGGATARVGGSVQVSAVTPLDFTNPVVYSITAQNGVNVLNWTVTASVTAPTTTATLTSAAYGVSNSAGTIYNVPITESLSVFRSNLTPATNATFEIYESNGMTVATDLQTGYKVIVIAQDGVTTKTYTIASSAANFVTYTIAGVSANLNNATRKITATLPFGANVTNLAASYTVSAGASASVGGTSQVSGVSVNNFTNPVVYDISAEDATTTLSWTVTITVTAPSTDASLTSLAYTVNNANSTILNVPSTETLNAFKNNITAASGATFEVYQANGTTVANDLQLGYKVRVTAQDGTTTKTYLIASSAANFVTFIADGVNATIISSTHTIVATIPYGSSLTNIAPAFSVSSGATVKVGTTDQVSGVTTNNFTSFVDYKVTAEDGNTNLSWRVIITVAAPSSDAMVTSLVYTVKNTDKTITNVPQTETLNSFKNNITAAANGSFQVYHADGTTVATDLQTGYILIGKAQDNTTTISYVITVNTTQSNYANFISFKVAGYDANVSSPDIHTVTATLPFGADVSNTAAVFTHSAGVLSVTVGGVSQVSGVTANNFLNTLVYSITAEDGTVLNWNVTITVTAPSNDATISSADFTVDNAAGTIAGVPFTESLASFKSKLTPANLATYNVYQANGTTVATDLQNGYKVIVTAQDVNVVKTYTISITSAGSATASSSLVCSGNNSTLTLTGYAGTIQWQQSSDGSTGWINVSGGTGATTASYATAIITQTTYYRAAVDNGSNISYSNVLLVALALTPADAATIAGPDTICIGIAVNYSVPEIANATSYVWTIQGVPTETVSKEITHTFGNGFTLGSVQVFGKNTCFDGNPQIKLVRSNATVGDAGTITGPVAVCQGEDSVTYTLPIVDFASSYVWELPGGATGSSTTNSIDVTFGASAVAGNVVVRGSNICGVGASSTLALSVSQLPAAAGPINIGKAAVCQGESAITYGGSSIKDATSYVWTLPEGASGEIMDNLITVNYSITALSGNLTWRGHNTCGDGAPGTLAITVSPLPVAAGTISGLDTICQSQDGLVYKVPAINHATSYVWAVPAGASIVGLSSADSITVNSNISFAAGNINVYGSNRCGSGGANSIAVTVRPFPADAGTITGPVNVCQGEVSKNYTVPSIANASAYIWTLPAGITGTSTTNSINVDFDALAESGLISVAGTNKCYTGTGIDFEVFVNPVPANPGAIIGPAAVCPESSLVTYRVNPSTTIPTSGYIWTLPAGVTGTSTTKQITVNFGPTAVSSAISVKGHNTCDGPSSTQDVLIYAPFQNEQICLVTIDRETGKNMIVWEKTYGERTASYNVYRQGNIVNQFDVIGTVPFDSLTVFVDNTSVPEERQYKYKISAVDSCDNESGMSPWHKTMFLQYVSGSNGVMLSWQPYESEAGSMNFDSYIIMRGADSTALDSLTTISSDLFVFTDKSPEAKATRMFYRVGGVKHLPCDPAGLLIMGKKASSGPFVHSLSNLEDNRLKKGTGIYDNVANSLNLSVYPSPFTDQTSINYNLEKQSKMKVEVYNVVGEKIKVLMEESQSPGKHKLEMYASDVNYQPGVYYLKIYVDGNVTIRKTMLTR
jgi:hypothetical protein